MSSAALPGVAAAASTVPAGVVNAAAPAATNAIPPAVSVALPGLAPPGSVPWLDRVKGLLGPRGYDHSMRRSIQTLVIYEAKRCIQPRVGDLRPFQRKVALVDQAQALVNLLDFCLPHHKAEILWRTSTSREMVTPEICWKRFQLIQKEMERLGEQVKPFMEPERSHQEAVDLLEQHLFVSASGRKPPKAFNCTSLVTLVYLHSTGNEWGQSRETKLWETSSTQLGSCAQSCVAVLSSVLSRG